MPTDMRHLLESTAPNSSASPLRIDEELGIIYDARILGRNSRNTYGIPGVEGTIYSQSAMDSAVPLYEGMRVNLQHLRPTKGQPKPERHPDDIFGQLRNVRREGEEVRGDLHYLRSHSMAPRVVEDVRRGLGVYGLSHHAYSLPADERIDRQAKRLVIDRLAKVDSVDLVANAATNRNLWESQEPNTVPTKTYTLKDVLEARMKALSKPRQGWARHLLEDESMPMDAETTSDVAADGTDPDDAISNAFEASIISVVQSIIAGDTDQKDGLKKIKQLFKAHDKLTGDDEPGAVTTADEGESDGKIESLQAEVNVFRNRETVRDLCESEGLVKPARSLLKALCLLESVEDRKELIAGAKGPQTTPTPVAGRTPKSGPPGIQPKARALAESAYDADAAIEGLRSR